MKIVFIFIGIIIGGLIGLGIGLVISMAIAGTKISSGYVLIMLSITSFPILGALGGGFYGAALARDEKSQNT
ncbi:MAG: hypothetical protein AAF197_04825 [Pseudomonadota bacterium]